VYFAGNIEIMPGGVLTLDTIAQFTVDQGYNGLTQLKVDVNATLIMRNVFIDSYSGSGRFLVYGKLVMTSSTEGDFRELYLGPTSNARITSSMIYSNDMNGIHIDGCSPVISSNTIALNGMDGIFIENGAEPTIKSNLIALNQRGVYARDSVLTNVVDNIFAMNWLAGVYAEGVIGKIHSNIFLMDKNEIFVVDSMVSIEDNQIGYARLVDNVAQYSTVLSLLTQKLNISGLDLLGMFGGIGSSPQLASLLLEHVGIYSMNSTVLAKGNTYGMLTYAMYAEDSNIVFSDIVQNNVIQLGWLNDNLDRKVIEVPTFVYNGVYTINSNLTITNANIQCTNDAVFLDGSKAVITGSVLNASRFDVYAIGNSSLSMSGTTLDGELKAEDTSAMTWWNGLTVTVRNADGKLVANAPVKVTDKTGKVIANGTTDANGVFKTDVVAWTQTSAGAQANNAPYYVNATVDGKVLSQTVSGSQPQSLSMQAEKSLIDNIMLPLIMLVCLVVVVVVILAATRMRKK
jgi:parallel beta-helix repeat protein